MSIFASPRLTVGLAVCILLLASIGLSIDRPAERVAGSAQDSGAMPLAGGLKNIMFIQNTGQWDAAVDFCAQGSGSTVWFTDHGHYAVFYNQSAPVRPSWETPDDVELSVEYLTLKTTFVGASDQAVVAPHGAAVARHHYLRGAQPQDWVTNVPCYHSIEVENLYPGIGLRYYSRGQALEFDFLVAAGADPNQIRIAFDGVEDVALNDDGDLVLTTAWGDIIQHSPLCISRSGISGAISTAATA
jgi:hypothetical protein